jgi:hypothetical protein
MVGCEQASRAGTMGVSVYTGPSQLVVRREERRSGEVVVDGQ